jgi:lipopolysaccharide transport system permease protein
LPRLRPAGKRETAAAAHDGCLRPEKWSIARTFMSITLQDQRDQAALPPVVLTFNADLSWAGQNRHAWQDVMDGLRLWRLAGTLGWLDIKLRYRGSMLGPLWLTLSTAVMVGSLGVLYAALFNMNLHDYLPYLALSQVLWGFMSTLVGEASTCFTQAEGIIRSIRMPFFLQALRTCWRNLLVLGHNILVIVVVFAIFREWPGWTAVFALPGLALWTVDALAICLMLGAICARFRDIGPIVASVMQIAFFVTPILWKANQVGRHAWVLPLNPFYSLIEVVRSPLLSEPFSFAVWAAALGYSALLCGLTWLVFMRARSRLAFWL